MSGSSSNILSELTCSQCRGLYKSPKILPNCSHSFCLSCIKSLKIVGTTLACPDCKAISSIPSRGGVDAFITNIVVQRIIEKVQPSHDVKSDFAPDEGSNECQHEKEPGELCNHCNKSFCRQCSYRHMETIKEQTADLLTACEKGPSSECCEVLERFESAFEVDLETIEIQLDNAVQALICVFTDILHDHVSKLKQQARETVQGEMAKLRNEFDLNADSGIVALLRKDFLRLATSSIFKQKLEDYTNLHAEASEMNRRKVKLEQLSKLSRESSQLLSFTATADFSKLEGAMQNMHLGSFEIRTSALTTNSAKQDVDLPPIDTLSVGHANVQNLHNVVEKSVNEIAYRILALPTQQQFAVLSRSLGSSKIELFDSNGNSVKKFEICNPDPRIVEFHIDNLATDYRKAIFATVALRCGFEPKQKAIYRFWLNNVNDGFVEPVLFAMGRLGLSNTFKGIAVSSELKLIFTTEANFIVAYESTNLTRYETGWQVARWDAGPLPYLHSVFDHFIDGVYSLAMICSINDGGKTFHWSLQPVNLSTGRSDRGRLAKTTKRDFYIEEIQLESSGNLCKICFYDDGTKALVLNKGKLCNYVSLIPELSCAFPELTTAGKGNEGDALSLSVLTSKKCQTLAISRKTGKKECTLTFAQLIDDK